MKRKEGEENKGKGGEKKKKNNEWSLLKYTVCTMETSVYQCSALPDRC